jgi:hypothetical protein
MQIIPHRPHKTDSYAELLVFDKLRESFVGNKQYIAFHSLNLTKHKYKRFGEADFVILCERGLFVLEVKGGGISCEEGIWYTKNKKGKSKIQHPFKQAEGALHAIRKEIKDSHKFDTKNLSIGYGVIFPQSSWMQASSEWDLNTVCDQGGFRNFESWLNKFFRYWENKPGNYHKLSGDNIGVIKQFLRPNFELLEPLHSRISNLEIDAVTLTEDQYKYLDIVSANPRVLCSGGAGTGKTFLAAELSRRLARENKNLLFLCKSNWLKRYLEPKIINEFVTVSSMDSLLLDMNRYGINKYDVMVVDEGQDLFNIDDMDVLDDIIKGGLSDGEWYIFYDVNNQAGLFSDTNLEVLELLISDTPAKIPLTTNCRNSRQILDRIKEALNLDMGNTGTGQGPEVRENHGETNSGKILNHEIEYLLENGISSSAITILSPNSYENSSIQSLPDKVKNQIIKLDEYSVRSFPPDEMSFSEIKNFKGMENEVIIMIDLPHPDKNANNDSKVLHYVAMSRARALLSVIWSPQN